MGLRNISISVDETHTADGGIDAYAENIDSRGVQRAAVQRAGLVLWTAQF